MISQDLGGYRPRINRILEDIDGGDMLDNGCVGESIDYSSDEWLHGRLRDRADSLKGIDPDIDGVVELQKEGWSVEHDDAESLNTINSQFDYVVAAEVIEHLSCPGDMFGAVSEVLRPEGQFLLTTPNPWSFVYLKRNVIRGQPHDKKWHTCWFDSGTIQELASRYGFEGKVEYLPLMSAGLSSLIYPVNEVIGGTRIYANFWLKDYILI